MRLEALGWKPYGPRRWRQPVTWFTTAGPGGECPQTNLRTTEALLAIIRFSTNDLE